MKQLNWVAAGGLLTALIVFVASAAAASFSNPTAIAINDPPAAATATPYPSTITAGGLTGTVTDVTVELTGFSHTFPGDVDILLVGPSGENTLLMSDACGDPDMSGVDLTFDDAAADTLPENPVTACASGSYKPTDYGVSDAFPAPAPAPSGTVALTNFTGTDPNGTWSLYVVDDDAGDAGAISGGWSLSITTSGSPLTMFSNPTAITIDDLVGTATPYPSTIPVSGLGGTVSDVNVTLTGFTHGFPEDVDILLVGPTGANSLLMSDACGDQDMSGVDLTFDDAAAAPLPEDPPVGSPCASDSYQPTNYGGSDVFPAPAPAPSASVSLTNFTGTDPNGTWSLYVVDDASMDAGSIAGGWSLEIATGTTAVEVAGLRAARVAGGVLLTWRTAAEVEVAGFDVYRGRTKLNRAPIAAKRAGTARGASYRLLDRSAVTGPRVYRLQLVRPDGRRTPAGSVSLLTR